MKHTLLIGGDFVMKSNDVLIEKTPSQDMLKSSLESSKRLIFLNKIPGEKIVTASAFPIVVHIDSIDRYKLPAYVKRNFTITYQTQEMNIFKVLSAVFYNKDRNAVYTILCNTKPPIILLYKWMECNAHRVWTEIPESFIVLDMLMKKVSQDNLYKYIAYALPLAHKRVQFKWLK